jgi:hypothetical protein
VIYKYSVQKGFKNVTNEHPKDFGCDQWLDNYRYTLTKKYGGPEFMKVYERSADNISIELPLFIVHIESEMHWEPCIVNDVVSLYDLIQRYIPLIRYKEEKRSHGRP